MIKVVQLRHLCVTLEQEWKKTIVDFNNKNGIVKFIHSNRIFF